MSIYKKVSEIKKKIPYLQQNTKGFNYTYVAPSQLLGVINPMLEEAGIWIDYDIDDIKHEIMPNSEVYMKMYFTFFVRDIDNPESVIVCKRVYQDIGGTIQKSGGLYTYGMRYFLLGFLMIPNDKDDPDAQQKKIEKVKPKSEEEVHEKGRKLQAIIDKYNFLDKKSDGFKYISELAKKSKKKPDAVIDSILGNEEKFDEAFEKWKAK